MNNIYTIEPLKCTPEFYQELVKIFQDKVITPGSNINEVMYTAGQQSVLRYIKQLVQGTDINSDIRGTIKPASFINRTVQKLTGRENADKGSKIP